MKLIYVFLALLGTEIHLFSDTKPKQELIWSDEFKGNILDYSKWGVEENAYGGGNN